MIALLCFYAGGSFAAPAVRLWDGGGFPATNWSVAANWVGDIPPSPGDDVVFPAGAPGNTNYNDLGPGVSLNSVTIGGPGYLLRGVDPLAVAAGIICTNVLGNNTILVPLAVAGSMFTISNTAGGSLSLNGSLNLNGQDATFACGGSILMFSPVTNAGGITKVGAGSLQFGQANAYDGATRVLEGRLTVLHNAGLGTADGGTIVAAGAELQILNGRSLVEPLRLAGTLSSGLSATNEWTGPITLLETNAVIAVNSGGALAISGVVDGPGGFHKTLGGELFLKANNTYTGPTLIEGGALFINGLQPSSGVVVAPGGILRGVGGRSGTVSNSAFGIIQPGDATQLSVFNISGGLTGATFSRVELRLSAGGILDSLSVKGEVSLGGGVLQVSFVGTPPPSGSAFQIIDNDDADAVIGTFAALPEGGLYIIGGVVFQITYRGGDGNDVVLTRVSEPTTIAAITCLTNGFKEIRGAGLPNVLYVLEAAPDLDSIPPKWAPIATNSAGAAGVYLFIDQDASLFPMRFYRILSP